ncbi:hypothetical protein K450DRAFT_255628 [Umbelopsis ramanniana AG]|uniref:HpcH/HpaI aldolase/citrate lyase domain-containing protein n=1 Tax=Umbelopsis ramanniana AG TaxID=1314678 RepID=A0AAD5HA98_UMBRA|nr:uncharacterized protein K450DRAFT_255628 [Umbelopsis ramanniana AG]KAI8576677.1 hypothetical protein K450DRAFT_255628 [Umbelopsis ramanniana AG]
MTIALKSFSLLAYGVKPQMLASTIATTSRPVVFRSSVFAAVRLLNTSSTEIKNGISTKLSENRPRRALFYVPGSDERKLHKSISVAADCIVYDLEDSVAASKKGSARQMIMDALEASEHGKAEKAVRINAVGSGLELDDLNVVLHTKRLQAIVIPKVQSAKDIQFVSRMIDSVAPESNRANIRLIASVESAMGIMNLKEIATADPRLDALIFAAEDYCADLGLVRTPSRLEMLFARQQIVTTASAFGLQSIDLVCVDYQNLDILKEECREGREFGFTGKQAIHPGQIDTIQEYFLPDPKDVERAVKIMDGFELYSKKGVGAFVVDGKMIDMPVIKWAQKVVAKAKAGGMEIPELDAQNANDGKNTKTK